MHTPRVDANRVVSQTWVSRIEHHQVLGSTNDRAKQCAVEGPGPLPLLIVADHQTAGRGRGANRWWTGEGSLAFSLLLEADPSGRDPARAAILSLAAAVAVAETLIPELPGRTVGIHWPNDVYAARRKVAGVLVEQLADGLVVVGIGVNLNNRIADGPSEIQALATSLSDLTGTCFDPTRILCAILQAFGTHLDAARRCPAQVAQAADRLCLQHGRTLCVESGGRTIRGVCGGIATDGALLLRTSGGWKRILHGTLRAP